LKSGKLTPAEVRGVLHDEDLEFPRGALRMRFSDNHDKCAWDRPALPRYGPQAVGLAAVMTYVLPGVPLIYNGQEAGNTRNLSLFEKMEIDWAAPDHGLRKLYSDLGRVRRENAALRRGALRLDEVFESQGVLTVIRAATGPAGGESSSVVALLNLKSGAVSIDLTACEAARGATALLTNGGRKADRVELPAFGWWIGEGR
jgi:hypothetical protein